MGWGLVPVAFEKGNIKTTSGQTQLAAHGIPNQYYVQRCYNVGDTMSIILWQEI
jgi:hypothetical protein